jgi:ketosteroid isomerase-like protein
MSQENVEIVRRAYDLVTRGDIAGMVDIISPQFELRENVLAPDAAVYHGREGLKKWLDASLEAFGDFRFAPERFIERGDWIFVPVHSYGRGKASGAPFDARYVTAFKVELGKVVLAASYQDLSAALKAAGLGE